MKIRTRTLMATSALALLASCAAVLALPDPTLDETIPPGGGSSSGTGSSSGSAGGDGSVDGGGDDGDTVVDGGGPLKCTGPAPWQNIVQINVSGPSSETYVSLTDDELAIVWIDSTSGNGLRVPQLAKRDAAAAPFGTAVPLAAAANNVLTGGCLGTRAEEVFFSNASAGSTMQRWRVLANETTQGPFTQTGLASGSTVDNCGTLLADASIMYFSGESPLQGVGSIFRAERTGADTWDGSLAIPLADAGVDVAPVVRVDELEIFFSRREGNASFIYTARRAKRTDMFDTPTKVTELTGIAGNDVPAWLSRDGCRLYFTSTRGDGSTNSDIWMATRAQ
jgi:hypothetical protein